MWTPSTLHTGPCMPPAEERTMIRRDFVGRVLAEAIDHMTTKLGEFHRITPRGRGWIRAAGFDAGAPRSADGWCVSFRRGPKDKVTREGRPTGGGREVAKASHGCHVVNPKLGHLKLHIFRKLQTELAVCGGTMETVVIVLAGIPNRRLRSAVCGILGSGEQTRIESCITKDSRFHGSVTEYLT
jgi:hypothetical protein